MRLCAPLPPTVSVNPLLDASLPARVLAFYVIAPVAEPEAAVDRHRDFLTAREMSGRVYLSADGMNAQVSGLAAACAEYRDFVAAEFPSERLLFKEDPVDELAFPRLRVKHKALVPEMADGAAVDLADRGEDVAPEEWQRMLAERNTSNVRVLDVRNGYEWDVGRFDGAERPKLDTFAEFEPETFGLPSGGAEAAETPVMMYCTGGIRCEIFSAKLKQRGFKKVYKLQGGIQHYGNALAAGALGTAAPDDAARRRRRRRRRRARRRGRRRRSARRRRRPAQAARHPAGGGVEGVCSSSSTGGRRCASAPRRAPSRSGGASTAAAPPRPSSTAATSTATSSTSCAPRASASAPASAASRAPRRRAAAPSSSTATPTSTSRRSSPSRRAPRPAPPTPTASRRSSRARCRASSTTPTATPGLAATATYCRERRRRCRGNAVF